MANTPKILPDLAAQKAAALARAKERTSVENKFAAEQPVLDCYLSEKGANKGKLIWFLKFGFRRQIDAGMLRWVLENPAAAKAFLTELDKSNKG